MTAQLSNASIPLVFLQTNLPGITPYCGGAHVWGDVLSQFSAERPVHTVDLPGCANGPLIDGALTIPHMRDSVISQLAALQLDKAHVIAHDMAGVVALVLAMDHPERLASITIAASEWAAPTGDRIENFTLRYPPEPLWSKRSQRWAYEHLSYSHLAITPSLVERSEQAAQGPAHQSAVRWAQAGGLPVLMESIHAAKSDFYLCARGEGLSVPVQIIIGKNDKLASVEHTLYLFDIIREKQPRTTLHIMNQCGNFPFLDDPATFYRLVSAFHDGLESELRGA